MEKKNISNLMDITCDSEPVYCDNFNYIKTKTKICRDKVNTNCQCKNVPKENSTNIFVINNVRFCY